MVNPKKTKKLPDEFDYSPLAKPWQMQHLITEETSYQYHRLFRIITWSRLLVAAIILISFIVSDTSTLTLLLPIVSVSMSLWALWATNDTYNNNRLYALLYALFDMLTFAYLIQFSSNSYELGFIFFTLAVNAILLSFVQLLWITCLAAVLLAIGWFDINFNRIHLLISLAFWTNIEVTQKLKGLLTLIVGLFVLALIVYYLTKQALDNEIKVLIQEKQLRKILSFNRSIVENFKNGILIFSADAETRMISINKKAVELLNIKDGERITVLSELSPLLFKYYREWSSSLLGSANTDDSFTYQHNQEAEEVFVSFTEFIQTDANSIIMMTLESVNNTMQQAQEAKLVALGRLTAGIAHEIRNPLAAISAAMDLLNEANDDSSKQRLVPIINKNIQRTNRIIDDILSLFKDKKADRQLLSILQSLNHFSETFRLSNKDSAFKIAVEAEDTEELYFKFDASQLEQILWNLCINSIKYSQATDLIITIKYRLSSNRKRVYLYVCDNGYGISYNKAKRIFEPFYAGSSEGSGLGLYLVRELCHANNANIIYLLPQNRHPDLPANGACFRISASVYFSRNIKPQID